MTVTTRPSASLYPDDPRMSDAKRLGARNGSGVGLDRHRLWVPSRRRTAWEFLAFVGFVALVVYVGLVVL